LSLLTPQMLETSLHLSPGNIFCQVSQVPFIPSVGPGAGLPFAGLGVTSFAGTSDEWMQYLWPIFKLEQSSARLGF
jgi:hypothetical protein